MSLFTGPSQYNIINGRVAPRYNGKGANGPSVPVDNVYGSSETDTIAIERLPFIRC